MALVAAVVAVLLFVGRDDAADANAPATATEDGGFRFVTEAEVEGLEPVHVAFYDDFLCAGCADAETQIGGYLRQQADLGLLELEYRPVALPGDTRVQRSYAVRAAAAAACVAENDGMDGYLTYRTSLYRNVQPLTSGGYEHDVLVDLAEQSDLTDSSDCIDSGSYESWVTARSDAAMADGVDPLPAILVEGEPVDAGQDGAVQLPDILAAVAQAQVVEETG